MSFHQNTESTNPAREETYSPLVVAEVKSANGAWVKAKFFLDNGSNASLIRRKLAEQLKLFNCGAAKVQFDVAGGSSHQENGSNFLIEIRAMNSTKSYPVLVTGVQIPCARVRPVSAAIFSQFEHLNEHKDTVHISGGEVDILIGGDYGPLIQTERSITAPVDPDNSPSIACTRLGSYIYGGLNNPLRRAMNNVLSVNAIDMSHNINIEQLRHFFYSDVIGVKPTSICVCSDKEIAESAFIKHVRKTTKINEEGRVEVSCPWRPGFPSNLPNNFFAVREQMIRKQKQCERNGKLEVYNSLVHDLINRRFVRILSPEETMRCPDENSWYLSHHMVERLDKETSKYRLVFNSALPHQGVCLNDAFEKGPDYTNSLFAVFLQWRDNAIAVSGDMEKMFNQISTNPDDRRYHRFLWRFDSSSPILVFEWSRVLFGDKPSPDLAGFAIRFLADLSKEEYPVGADKLKNNTYVDDVGYSTSTTLDANDTKQEVSSILKRGQFSVKCWNSNCLQVDENQIQRSVDFLGHLWDKRNDTIQLKQKETFNLDNFKFTKSFCLGLIARFWDLSGLLLPVTIRYRRRGYYVSVENP